MSSSDEDIERILMKKKKKKASKKKKVESDEEDSGAEETTTETKKEEKAPQESKSANEKAPSPAPISGDPDSDLEAFYALLRRTKKKKKHAAEAEAAMPTEVDWEEFQKNESKEYTYQQLLSRVYTVVRERNPQLGMRTVCHIRPPNVVKDGPRKVAFTNFSEICKSLNRSEDHFFSFTLTELSTSGNVDGNNCLILKGRFSTKHIENLIKKYINAYVICGMCHSLDTKLVKDPHSRLTTLICNQCNATKTVQSITGGYTAQIGRRKRN